MSICLYILVLVCLIMVKFLCVTCQSIKDDMHQKWTDAGVSTCTQCVTDKTSIGHITSNCIETVLEDMSKTPYERDVMGYKGLFS